MTHDEYRDTYCEERWEAEDADAGRIAGLEAQVARLEAELLDARATAGRPSYEQRMAAATK